MPVSRSFVRVRPKRHQLPLDGNGVSAVTHLLTLILLLLAGGKNAGVRAFDFIPTDDGTLLLNFPKTGIEADATKWPVTFHWTKPTSQLYLVRCGTPPCRFHSGKTYIDFELPAGPTPIEFVDFHFTGSAGGSAVRVTSGTVIFRNCHFTGNSDPNGDAKGAALRVGPGATAIAQGCTFADNDAGPGGRGGAVYNEGRFRMEDTVMRNNSALDGGAVYNGDGGALQIRGTRGGVGAVAGVGRAGASAGGGGTRLVDNRAERDGGAVYMSAGSSAGGSSSDVLGAVSFVGNAAGRAGPAVYEGGAMRPGALLSPSSPPGFAVLDGGGVSFSGNGNCDGWANATTCCWRPGEGTEDLLCRPLFGSTQTQDKDEEALIKDLFATMGLVRRDI